MIIRILLIAAGTLFLILGIIGIVVPGLPTTPFLLLTAGLYVRSSDRLYQKLIHNPYLGGYINRWQSSRRLSLKTKIASIFLMWIMISISVIFMVDRTIIHLIIVLAGMTGTIVMGLILPTDNK